MNRWADRLLGGTVEASVEGLGALPVADNTTDVDAHRCPRTVLRPHHAVAGLAGVVGRVTDARYPGVAVIAAASIISPSGGVLPMARRDSGAVGSREGDPVRLRVHPPMRLFR